MNSSKPFDVDPPKPVDPIAEAKLALRQRFERERVAQKERFHAQAEEAYAKHLADVRTDWIRSWKRDNAPDPVQYPYTGASDAEILRIASDPAERISKLLEAYTATRDVDFLAEATKVWLYRRKSRAPLADVKTFLKDHIPVDGDAEIFTEHVTEHQVLDSPVGRSTTGYRTNKIVIASNLSVELKAILRSLTMQHGIVIFATRSEFIDTPGRPGERITLAHDDPDYPSDQW